MRLLLLAALAACVCGCATTISTSAYGDRDIEKEASKVGVRVELKTTF